MGPLKCACGFMQGVVEGPLKGSCGSTQGVVKGPLKCSCGSAQGVVEGPLKGVVEDSLKGFLRVHSRDCCGLDRRWNSSSV